MVFVLNICALEIDLCFVFRNSCFEFNFANWLVPELGRPKAYTYMFLLPPVS